MTSNFRQNLFLLQLLQQVPHAAERHALDISLKQMKDKIREIFRQNMHIQDLRVIDMLCIKVRIVVDHVAHQFLDRLLQIKYYLRYKVNQKTFMHLAGYGIKGLQLILLGA